MEMRSLRRMRKISLKDRAKNNVIREQCVLNEDVVVKIEKEMLRWFGHMEIMDKTHKGSV